MTTLLAWDAADLLLLLFSLPIALITANEMFWCKLHVKSDYLILSCCYVHLEVHQMQVTTQLHGQPATMAADAPTGAGLGLGGEVLTSPSWPGACHFLKTINTSQTFVQFSSCKAETFPGRLRHPAQALSEAWVKKFRMNSGTTMSNNCGHFLQNACNFRFQITSIQCLWKL